MKWLLHTAARLAADANAILYQLRRSTGGDKHHYVTSAPNPQAALDIFRDSWISKLPHPLADLRAGSAELFEDQRIHWFVNAIGGVDNLSVLDLGPLEGGHSYMMQQMGASAVTAIEANTQLYMRCLVIKELLRLDRVRFLCGNFVEHLRATDTSFDICIASGVLYHMSNPAELIALLAQRCRGYLYIWTHYFDADIIAQNLRKSYRHSGVSAAEYEGFKHVLHRHEYWEGPRWSNFIGGVASHSNWMARDDLMRCLEYFGFRDIRVGFDQTDHPKGPSLALVARGPQAT